MTRSICKETYILKWYKKVGYYLLSVLEIDAMIIFCMLVLSPIINMTLIAKGTVFGDVPTWIPMLVGMSTLSPFLGIVIYLFIRPEIYSKEIKEGLFPIQNGRVISYPYKVFGVPPKWISKPDNRVYSIKFHNNSNNYKNLSIVKVIDIDSLLYVDTKDLSDNIIPRMIDGTLKAEFEFVKFEKYHDAYGIKFIREVNND